MTVSVEKDQLYEMEITKLGDSGEGIGSYKGMNIFVGGGVVGDFVKVKITGIKKTYAMGRVVKLIQASKLRTEPACPYFRTCGVCQIMNMDYQKGQLSFKQGVVVDALSQFEGLKDTKVLPILGMRMPLRYRNMALYTVGQGNVGVKLGFHEKGSHKVVDVQDCLLQNVSHIKINQVIREFITEFGIQTYDEGSHKGLLRQILIRESDVTGDLMVVFVLNGRQIPKDSILVERLLEAVPEIKSIIINENTLKASRCLGPNNRVISGDETILNKMGNVEFAISPQTEFPVNSLQAEVFYRTIFGFAGLKGEETVAQLYNADDVLATILIQKSKLVVSATEIPKLLDESTPVDVLVIEPTKKGCDAEKIETIFKLAPQKMIYISGKPSIMARDLNAICESGLYEVKKVQAVDLFVMMTNVDCIALIEKKLV